MTDVLINELQSLLTTIEKLESNKKTQDLINQLNSAKDILQGALKTAYSVSTDTDSSLAPSKEKITFKDAAPGRKSSFQEIYFGDSEIQYKYSKDDVLGTGSFGTVYKCFISSDEDKSEPFAVKVPNKINKDSFNGDFFIKEAEALNVLDHPNIIRFYNSFFRHGKYFYSVMEFVEGRELEKCGIYSEADAKPIIMQLFKGLHYLHNERKPPFMHRDIKPENVMVLNKLDPERGALVKFVDFGLTKRLQDSKAVLKTIAGTHNYMAPEVARPGA